MKKVSLNDKNTKTRLNLGCGADYKEGWLNADKAELEIDKKIKKDIYLDLNKFPYALKEDQFEEILMAYVIEYLDEPIKCLKELVRISKNNAKITLYVVHTNSYAAISHLNFKNKFTENTFVGNRLAEYGLDKKLVLSNIEFVYIHKWKKYIPFKKHLKLFLLGVYDALKIEFVVKK